MKHNLRMALGLSMRAGKCIAGDFACEQAVKKEKAKLVLVEEAASENTKQRYGQWCRARNIPCLTVSGAADAVGKPAGMVFAISDSGFAQMIRSAWTNEELNTDDGR